MFPLLYLLLIVPLLFATFHLKKSIKCQSLIITVNYLSTEDGISIYVLYLSPIGDVFKDYVCYLQNANTSVNIFNWRDVT